MDNALYEPLYSATAYDDAFRTMETECDDLLIPYINFMCNEQYDETAVITRLRNEHFVEHEDHSEEKRITDSHFTITQNGISKRYHLECESKKYDGSILIRIFEYGAQIAIDTAERSPSKLKVMFPHTGLLMLKGSTSTPDIAEIIIETPKGSLSYDVPIIKISDFSVETIFEKKMYMLIPFLIFNYEKDLKKDIQDKTKVDELTEMYRDIIGRMAELEEAGALSSASYSVIISLTHSVLYNLMKDHDIVQEKVGDLMGGKVLDLPILRVFHDGQAKGRAEGIVEGRAEGEAERKRLQEENDALRKELDELKATVNT
ncbi:hypothetical protein SAMN02910292_01807 [Lachnospiraceae bacterium XBB2008]|nr:hypothetical protein SAMN02910292_01807 [Lachnospiraceae bacterium XBB2008]